MAAPPNCCKSHGQLVVLRNLIEDTSSKATRVVMANCARRATGRARNAEKGTAIPTSNAISSAQVNGLILSCSTSFHSQWFWSGKPRALPNIAAIHRSSPEASHSSSSTRLSMLPSSTGESASRFRAD